jgi:hypothetical protein
LRNGEQACRLGIRPARVPTNPRNAHSVPGRRMIVHSVSLFFRSHRGSRARRFRAPLGSTAWSRPLNGCAIDTPGMREVALFCDADALRATFDDVALVAEVCRFRDCRHRDEPDCAVRLAVDAGTLDAVRVAGFDALLAETQPRSVERRARERRAKERLGRRLALRPNVSNTVATSDRRWRFREGWSGSRRAPLPPCSGIVDSACPRRR